MISRCQRHPVQKGDCRDDLSGMCRPPEDITLRPSHLGITYSTTPRVYVDQRLLNLMKLPRRPRRVLTLQFTKIVYPSANKTVFDWNLDELRSSSRLSTSANKTVFDWCRISECSPQLYVSSKMLWHCFGVRIVVILETNLLIYIVLALF